MNRVGSPHIAPQPRDIAIMRELFHTRLMTLTHATSLFFDGRFEAAKKRIQRLKAAGFIGERPRRVYEPSILFLARTGFDLLRARGDFDAFPFTTWPTFQRRSHVKDSTLRHELDVVDIKAALVPAVRGTETLQLNEFSTWPRLIEFSASHFDGARVIVKPDGFIHISEFAGEKNIDYRFFLEVDRSTETLGTLIRKAFAYRDHYRSGGFAKQNGKPRTEFSRFPFRVLMVFQNAERRNNAADALLAAHPPILAQVWLTTFAEIISTPLAAIWMRPVDYRHVLKEQSFATPRGVAPAPYRRRRERETYVDNALDKLKLFGQNHSGQKAKIAQSDKNATIGS